ncbi:MAG TPA: PorV/PorQ family protein [Candidatus Krumholzibacteria bacterium]|nr:PorV/PorQ family protein [Candidatus Krumholzibacteria bacterium]
MRLYLAAALLCVSIMASAAHATKLAGEFMAPGGGARALGMGGAFAAVAADASTVFWNPAGIAGIEKRQALAMHAEQFGDLVNYNFGAYVQPSTLMAPERKPAFGFALIHLGDPDQIVTNQLVHNDLNGNGQIDGGELVDKNGVPFDEATLPRESNNSFAGFGTFAIETGAGSVGGSLKIIYQDMIAGESSMGIGIDLGYLRRDFLARNLSLGAKLQDATGTYISWSTGTNEFIVPMLKIGSAYRVESEELNGALLVAVDADVFFDNRQMASQFWVETMSTDLHVGAELSFQEKVMIRGGFDAANYTAGAGIYFGVIGLDYAYLHHDAFEATHRVSVLASF